MAEGSIGTRVAVLEERMDHRDRVGEETMRTVTAIKEILDTQSPKWAVTADRVSSHNRAMWLMAALMVGSVWASVWTLISRR
jgi:hypothetical protein